MAMFFFCKQNFFVEGTKNNKVFPVMKNNGWLISKTLNSLSVQTEGGLVPDSSTLSILRGGASSNSKGEVHHISTLRELNQLLTKASTRQQLVVIDFTATWCGPCQRIAPIFEQIAKDYAGKVHFVKVS
jgi:thiol-disulfide isomerase/thioredoxin